jgi:hypothetical protein
VKEFRGVQDLDTNEPAALPVHQHGVIGVGSGRVREPDVSAAWGHLACSEVDVGDIATRSQVIASGHCCDGIARVHRGWVLVVTSELLDVDAMYALAGKGRVAESAGRTAQREPRLKLPVTPGGSVPRATMAFVLVTLAEDAGFEPARARAQHAFQVCTATFRSSRAWVDLRPFLEWSRPNTLGHR